MDEQEMVRRITSLEARMYRIERLMQQLLMTMTSSQTHIDQIKHLQDILRELRKDPDNFHMEPISLRQERPEMVAIRQALLAGNKLQAIKIYRSLYGVSLKDAQDAIDLM
jgi:ribosomal protein L7/L12